MEFNIVKIIVLVEDNPLLKVSNGNLKNKIKIYLKLLIILPVKKLFLNLITLVLFYFQVDNYL